MKDLKIALIIAVILFTGCVMFAGCSGGGGTPGGGLTFFGSGGGGGGAGPTPTPTPTPGPGGEIVLAEGRVNTYDLCIDGAFIYWTERAGGTSGGVFRTLIDGTGIVETVAAGYPQAYGLCIVGTTLYFTDRTQPTGRIVRVDISGATFVPEDYISGLTQPLWIRHVDGYLYWTEYFDPGRFLRVVQVPSGTAAPALADVEEVCSTLHYPFAFYLDGVNGRALLTELAGNSGRVMWVPLGVNQTANMRVIYQGMETYYGTSITYDSSMDMVYWCNFLSLSGVWRMARVPASGAVPEPVETGISRAFDVFGPSSGLIHYSLDEPRVGGGNIYWDLLASLTNASGTDITNSTITDPFRFTIAGGSYFWTEYPDFDPTNLDYGGSSTCRVMRYNP